MKLSVGILFSFLTVSQLDAAEDMRTRFYQKNGVVLSEQNSLNNKQDFHGNDANVQSNTRTTIKDGLIYDTQNRLLDTSNDGECIYVMNHDGVFFATSNPSLHHSYFLKSKPEKPFYGIGRNVACAGTLQAKDGKIIAISNDSGHYTPIKDQLVLAVQFLAKQGVMDPNATIDVQEPYFEGSGRKTLTLEEVMKENPTDILKKYPPAAKRTPEYQGYIEHRQAMDEALQEKVRELNPQCPTSFLREPVTNVMPDFQLPPHSSRKDLGQITLENKHWEAFLLNTWGRSDLPQHVMNAPASDFKWDKNFHKTAPFVTMHENGIVKRKPACMYSLMHMPEPQRTFYFYLVPVNDEPIADKNHNTP